MYDPEDAASTVRMTIGHLFSKKGADVFQVHPGMLAQLEDYFVSLQ
jgi:hypothetical protein